jgi:hypothetical protein
VNTAKGDRTGDAGPLSNPIAKFLESFSAYKTSGLRGFSEYRNVL